VRVLVTGGAGFLGCWLVDRLLALGQSVRVLLKDEEEPPNYWKGVECVRGNLLDQLSLTRAVDCVRAVYHLAGDLRTSQTAYIVNHRGTENLISVCSKIDLERFLFFSSVSVICEGTPGKWDERSICKPRNQYAYGKYMAELAVLKAGVDGKLPATVLRPSTVFGPRKAAKGDSFLSLMRAINKGQFRMIGRPGAIANYIFVQDVVDAALSISTRPEAIGQVFHITDSCPLLEFVGHAAKLLDVAPPKRIPLVMAYPFALLMEAIAKVSNRPMPLTRARIRAIASRAEFVSCKLGMIHPLSFGWREGLRITLADYEGRGLLD
jgi:nucleoside-diphosphate-sugar epimerase